MYLLNYYLLSGSVFHVLLCLIHSTSTFFHWWEQYNFAHIILGSNNSSTDAWFPVAGRGPFAIKGPNWTPRFTITASWFASSCRTLSEWPPHSRQDANAHWALEPIQEFNYNVACVDRTPCNLRKIKIHEAVLTFDFVTLNNNCMNEKSK